LKFAMGSSMADVKAGLAETVLLYRKCLDLTRAALARKSPDHERLKSLLDERAAMLDRIADVAFGLEQTAEGPFWGPEGRAADYPESIRDIRLAAEALREADRELRERLESEALLTGEELDKLRKGHATIKAYAPNRAARPVLLDRRG
jgi:hypothetical protein